MKKLKIFNRGGVIYTFIEVFTTAVTSGSIALKGQSSLWMYLLGGKLLVILGKLNETKLANLPLILQAIIGGVLVTLAEFIAGMILNVWLGFNLWDYTGKPLAHLFFNQINLWHSIGWVLLAPYAFWLEDDTNGKKYNLFEYYLSMFGVRR
jgi:uncharacterized membrane protein